MTFLSFLQTAFFYFFSLTSFSLTSFSLLPFHSFFYFTFFSFYFPNLTLLSKSYFTFHLLLYFLLIFKTSSPFWYTLIWPNPIWFCFFNPSFSCFLVRFICICCCFPFTGLKYLIFYSITISHHGEMFQTNTWQD